MCLVIVTLPDLEISHGTLYGLLTGIHANFELPYFNDKLFMTHPSEELWVVDKWLLQLDNITLEKYIKT